MYRLNQTVYLYCLSCCGTGTSLVVESHYWEENMRFHIVRYIAADGRVTQATTTSAVMIFNQASQHIPPSAPGGLKISWTAWLLRGPYTSYSNYHTTVRLKSIPKHRCYKQINMQNWARTNVTIRLMMPSSAPCRPSFDQLCFVVKIVRTVLYIGSHLLCICHI